MTALGAQALNRKLRLKHLWSSGRGRLTGQTSTTHTPVRFIDEHTVSLTVDGTPQHVAHSISDHITEEQLLSLDNPFGVLGRK